MSTRVLIIKMLLLHYTTQSQTLIQANCKDNVTLKCSDVGSMEFLSMAWYKIVNEKHFGIIGFDESHKLQDYNFQRAAEFRENYSLLLPSVTAEDSGLYECAHNANIGFKNKYSRVNLTIEDCTTQKELTTTTNALSSTLKPLLDEKDLPVLWIVAGSAAVGVAKIILSLISIWVIQAFRILSSRRRQEW